MKDNWSWSALYCGY